MKVIITAAEQAQAINEYILKYYGLLLTVYPEEYDDKDMEVQPIRTPNNKTTN